MLVFQDMGSADEERLQLAASVALDHGAYLSAAFPQDHPMIQASQSAGPADSAEQRFRDCLRTLGEGEWYPLDHVNTTTLITLARAADLIIIGQMNPYARRTSALLPEEIVVASGRPVLMVPCIGTFDRVGRRVLVAWDGPREAPRALNDVLPVISAVTVMNRTGFPGGSNP